MTFVQIMRYEATHFGETDEWVAATEGKRTATRDTHTQDRDHPGHYVDIIEFPSNLDVLRDETLPGAG